MSKKPVNPVQSIRERLRQAANASGLTMQEIGEKMGFTKGGARQAVSRLLNPEIDYDPRLSTLSQCAEAIGRQLKDFV